MIIFTVTLSVFRDGVMEAIEGKLPKKLKLSHFVTFSDF